VFRCFAAMPNRDIPTSTLCGGPGRVGRAGGRCIISGPSWAAAKIAVWLAVVLAVAGPGYGAYGRNMPATWRWADMESASRTGGTKGGAAGQGKVGTCKTHNIEGAGLFHAVVGGRIGNGISPFGGERVKQTRTNGQHGCARIGSSRWERCRRRRCVA
jgi:hypothetical protein